MVHKVGYAVGTCPECGRVLRRERPASSSICDCYRRCPLCGCEMEPYKPDLEAENYRVEDVLDPTGRAERSERGLAALLRCPCCGYLSRLKPQVVRLS
ncbi:hypothetical protein DRO56_01620 [Candidatus Bathyarchaeota archaeon]|nr:MAG: hypothetical protein DRO56_01620 [Candidatus Bathyarchaeota archaeon]